MADFNFFDAQPELEEDETPNLKGASAIGALEEGPLNCMDDSNDYVARFEKLSQIATEWIQKGAEELASSMLHGGRREHKNPSKILSFLPFGCHIGHNNGAALIQKYWRERNPFEVAGGGLTGTVRSSRERASWIDAQKQLLLQMLKASSRAQRGGWSRDTWERVSQVMKDFFPESNFTIEQLKQLEKDLHKIYNQLKQILMRPGFKWDNKNCMLHASSDNWRELLKSNGKLTWFRRKIIYYDALVALYEGPGVEAEVETNLNPIQSGHHGIDIILSPSPSIPLYSQFTTDPNPQNNNTTVHLNLSETCNKTFQTETSGLSNIQPPNFQLCSDSIPDQPLFHASEELMNNPDRSSSIPPSSMFGNFQVQPKNMQSFTPLSTNIPPFGVSTRNNCDNQSLSNCDSDIAHNQSSSPPLCPYPTSNSQQPPINKACSIVNLSPSEANDVALFSSPNIQGSDPIQLNLYHDHDIEMISSPNDMALLLSQFTTDPNQHSNFICDATVHQNPSETCKKTFQTETSGLSNIQRPNFQLCSESIPDQTFFLANEGLMNNANRSSNIPLSPIFGNLQAQPVNTQSFTPLSTNIPLFGVSTLNNCDNENLSNSHSDIAHNQTLSAPLLSPDLASNSQQPLKQDSFSRKKPIRKVKGKPKCKNMRAAKYDSSITHCIQTYENLPGFAVSDIVHVAEIFGDKLNRQAFAAMNIRHKVSWLQNKICEAKSHLVGN